MADVYWDELSPLVQKIMKGKTSSKKVSRKLNEIGKRYGEDETFIHFEPENVPSRKGYTKDYLNNLENLFYCGAVSKDMVNHMAEVSDQVHHPVRTAARRHPAAATGIGVAGAAGIGAGSYLLAKKLKKMRDKKKKEAK